MIDFKSLGLKQTFISTNSDKIFLITDTEIKALIRPRKTDSHKGIYGHALLIGGSYGKVGAARLASEACLRAGVGLLTAFVPKCAYVIMQSTVPECMLITAETATTVSQLPEIKDYKAIAIGPGLGQENECLETLAILLISCQLPLVIDADALNLIAENPHLLVHLPENSVFTPHPKELERLTGTSADRTEQVEKASAFAQEHKIILILKGAITAICCPDGAMHFNTTGNPGMATAGAGDALTGIILSLIAQGYSPKEASLIAVFKHGEAGDNAAEKRGQSAVLARDIIENLRID